MTKTARKLRFLPQWELEQGQGNIVAFLALGYDAPLQGENVCRYYWEYLIGLDLPESRISASYRPR